MQRLLLFIFIILGFASCIKQPNTVVPDTTVSTFRESGLDVSWDYVHNRLAYSSKGSDGYYDIHVSNVDGSNDVCITCDHPELPNKHIANMYWHPNGDWLVAVVEKPEHERSSYDALPGFGAFCDIWLISADGHKVFKIVDIPNDYDHGVIAPRFSPDGKKLVWAERKARPDLTVGDQLAGYWSIKMADFMFTVDSFPIVSNTRILEPAGTSFYEVYGFSPDGSKLIFCSCINSPSWADQHIYTMDTNGNNLTKLTETDYNEHAFYTPDGNHIVWMTNTDNSGGTDWWMMDPDGSNKKRLTYLNERGNEQYVGQAVWACMGIFDPTGHFFIGTMQLNLVSQEGKILRVDLH